MHDIDISQNANSRIRSLNITSELKLKNTNQNNGITCLNYQASKYYVTKGLETYCVL